MITWRPHCSVRRRAGIRRDEYDMRQPDAVSVTTSESGRQLRWLTEQLDAHRRRHRELASQLAHLAGQIADAEDRIARLAERSAQRDPVRADEYGRRARRAKAYSAYERSQQRRWAAVAAGIPGR